MVINITYIPIVKTLNFDRVKQVLMVNDSYAELTKCFDMLVNLVIINYRPYAYQTHFAFGTSNIEG